MNRSLNASVESVDKDGPEATVLLNFPNTQTYIAQFLKKNMSQFELWFHQLQQITLCPQLSI